MELLVAVGMKDAAVVAPRQFPFELSGGMHDSAMMIAIALSGRP